MRSLHDWAMSFLSFLFLREHVTGGFLLSVRWQFSSLLTVQPSHNIHSSSLNSCSSVHPGEHSEVEVLKQDFMLSDTGRKQFFCNTAMKTVLWYMHASVSAFS